MVSKGDSQYLLTYKYILFLLYLRKKCSCGLCVLSPPTQGVVFLNKLYKCC